MSHEVNIEMSKFDLGMGTVDCPIKTVALILHNSRISSCWKKLAKGLGLPDVRVEQFETDLKMRKITEYDLIHQILEIWVGMGGSRATLFALLSVVEDICEDETAGETVRLEFHLPCRGIIINDDDKNSTISWPDLSPAYQNRVMENIGKVLPTLKSMTEEIEQLLTGSILLSLMTSLKDINLFEQTIPPNPNYYVSRTLLSRRVISADIFDQLSPSDIFLFTGMDRYQLGAYANNKMIQSSSELMKGINVNAKFIILDNPLHFEKICVRTEDSVHWLHHHPQDGKFHWIRSRGQMGLLQKCIDEDKAQLGKSDVDICASLPLSGVDNQAICISDTPGMGKSVLLVYFGNSLRKMHPDRTVIFSELTQFIQQFKAYYHLGTSKMSAIEKALVSIACENELGVLALKSKLMETQNDQISIELLLDGFDEINDEGDQQLAYQILQIIKTTFKSIRVWVTSRPHFLQPLENCLGTLGYKIKSFGESDQLTFLTAFWSRDTPFEEEVKFRLRQFAGKCLDILKSNMGDSTDEDIAGIPLQCLLLGEVYEEEAIAFIRDFGKALSSAPVPMVTIINSTSDLYKYTIAKKIQKYLSVHHSNQNIDEIMKIHAFLSIQLILPDYAQKLEHLFPPADNVGMTELLKVGILEMMAGEQPRFLHRTFADYFIAWFVLSHLDNVELCQFILVGVLGCRDYSQHIKYETWIDSSEFVHHVVAYFMNSLLGDRFGSADTTMDLNSFQHFHKLFDDDEETLQKIVHSCINADFYNIFEFFNPIHAFDRRHQPSRSIFSADLVIIGIEISSLPLVRRVLSHFESSSKFDLSIQMKALKMAVWRGNFSILEYLLHEKGLLPLILELTDQNRELLHECVGGSAINSERELDQKIQVIRLLVKINPKLLDGAPRSPLFAEFAHVRLLHELLNIGVDVLARNGIGENVLHQFCERARSTVEQLHEFIMGVPLDKMKELVETKDDAGNSPLAKIIRLRDPLPETLDRMRAAGADFNSVDDKDGYALLGAAIKSGRNMDTLRKLMECGADIHWTSPEGKCLLQIASEFGNLDALRFLVEVGGMDIIHVKDEDGHTLLDNALRSTHREGKRFETCMLLHEWGVGFCQNLINDVGQSLLHVASKDENLDTVRFLFHLDERSSTSFFDPNGKDNQGNTPLHLLLKHKQPRLNDYFAITNLLLEHNANPNALNNEGQTPFLLALNSQILNAETFQLLKSKTDLEWSPSLATSALKIVIRNTANFSEQEFESFIDEFEAHGADMNHQDDTGMGPLHIAAYYSFERAVRILLRKGADVNLANDRERTPLHIAAFGEDKHQSLEVIKCLISHGADVWAKDDEDNTFLNIYIFGNGIYRSDSIEYSELEDVVEYLVEGDPNQAKLFDEPGGELKATVLQLMLRYLEVDVDILETLHSAGVNFNAVDSNGDSALTYAILGRCENELTSALIDQFGADPTHLNYKEESLLHILSREGYPEELGFILGLGVLDINGKNSDGDTPLHLVSIGDKDGEVFHALEKFKLLVDHGADVKIRNEEGHTPVEIVMRDMREVIREKW